MSILFTPKKIGNLEIKNRFVRTATYEGKADEQGRVTEALINLYQKLARGDIGLILTGFMYVHPLGRAQKHQTAIYSDDFIPGLKKLADAVHAEGGKIAFEISHAGRQTTKDLIGQTPIGPSRKRRDPNYFIKPLEMTDKQVREVIDAFVKAAERSVKAGSDMVFVHAGGGDLLNQFISPFFNFRNDDWGGSDEKRFRILREILEKIRHNIDDAIPILVKMNCNDLTPQAGITPLLAKKYATWLAEIGVDALELTAGVKSYTHMNCWRGEIPFHETMRYFSLWKKIPGWLRMKIAWKGKYDLVEGWNLEDELQVKPAMGDMKSFIVGGLRRIEHMEEIVENGYADFVCMCRPFIREPDLVKKFKEGKKEVSCIYCNKCIGAILNTLPTACYRNGLPK
jgi:2,4-dienoyl-CoA reductase-like NADH-dependent reductase (Old Yellow Enzyme family)